MVSINSNISRGASLVAVLLAAIPMSAVAFTTPGMRPAAHSPLFVPMSPKADLSMVSAATAGNGASADNVLRDFEKKEAAMQARRAEAMKKLTNLEESLKDLETKKQAYLNGLELAETPPGGNFSETAVRSAVKAFMWRIIAGSVTFITSLRFSGSVATALSIVGSDFFSKALTMFIGERLMNKSQAGRKSGADGAGRSLVKALVWRLFAICNTLTMAIFIAKDISIASKIAGSDAIFKTALMFFYERAWAKIEWGKNYIIEFSI